MNESHESCRAEGSWFAWPQRHRRGAMSAGFVLLVLYALVSLLINPNGSLGTDTGAKVYTLEVMDRAGTADPDVGYWAEDFDPDGRLHPLFHTRPTDDGRWVNVTTLPILEVARPLYALGGVRAILLLPMLGSVGAAYASRSVARRLGAADGGWLAFWAVGLGSPAAVYALDFWEHSIGLACMIGSIAALLAVVDGRRLWLGLVAGALLGLSATLRNETFVYAFVGVAGCCVYVLLAQRRLLRAVSLGSITCIGFLGPWLVNLALERAVGGQSRAERATGTASRGGAVAGRRVEEAFRTLFGFDSGALVQSAVIGGVLVGVLLLGLWADRRGEHRLAMASLLAAGSVYVLGALGGLGFVPGLFVAFPVAIAGAVLLGRSARTRLVGGLAVVALPLVYGFQYLGGAAPQWGGRYTLTSSVLLGVVGLVGLGAQYPAMQRGMVALSFFVTALGVAWVIERSHGVDRFFEELLEEAEPVVISRNPFLIREGGAAVVGRRWLSVSDEDRFSDAIGVARDSGEERFTVLEYGGAAPPAAGLPRDVREIARSELGFLGVPVGAVSYEFTED